MRIWTGTRAEFEARRFWVVDHDAMEIDGRMMVKVWNLKMPLKSDGKPWQTLREITGVLLVWSSEMIP